MDFYRIKDRATKEGPLETYPDFRVVRSKDLMVQAKSFYAIWDEEQELWSQDEYDVQRLVDHHLRLHKRDMESGGEAIAYPKYMGDFSSGSWLKFRNYVAHLSDSSYQLDENLTFSNTKTKKSDYVSRRLPYPLEAGDYSAYEELIGTLYHPEERAKLEWAIGAIISGDAKYIQKFIVLYGTGGSGKSTFLNIVMKLFEGYYTTFEAKALTSSNNAFATEVFKTNPLVAIQHDGDLSKIEDNAKLNSIVSHEEMTMNEKYKPSYMARINAFLLMGTNKPVKITDAKSGIIRRLIDVKPSGNKVSAHRYGILVSQIDFELGAIAAHCLETYRRMGKNFYEHYRPIEMMLQTDTFYNYIEEHSDVFKKHDGVSLKQAYDLYKLYCEESNIEYKLNSVRFREELRNYFGNFEERALVDGVRVRSWYSDFQFEKLIPQAPPEEAFSLTMDETESIFDEMLADAPAQLATDDDFPTRYWDNEPRQNKKTGEMFTPDPSQVVDTTLKDIDTTKVHYVKVPDNHIVIDFDITDENGEKSLELNLAAASKWPPTYSEYSKGGGGIHLHYNYDGDTSQLSRIFSDEIEVKVYNGNSSLRRRLSKCNNIPVATINSGLPLKETKVINPNTMKTEKSLRELILRNLNKEIHSGTKPSMDFIHKILDDAYNSGMQYDVNDMRSKIMAFANNSSNHALYCLSIMQHIKFEGKPSDEVAKPVLEGDISEHPGDFDELNGKELVFFDCEVFPNLFIVCWKFEGADQVVRMINPSAQAIEDLIRMPLVGYNCRRYDNHILYGASLGYNNRQLYELSQKIIDNTPGATFGEAYNLSYVDIYDYASEKKSLKMWEIDLGLKHSELGLPWDEPVDPKLWEKVAAYCDDDVIATEEVHIARKGDFIARQILAKMSGLPVNDTTQRHTAKIVFGNDRNAPSQFVYTDLSEMFPGYKYDFGKSVYRDEDPGEGGYVYAEPGMYKNVALLDIASMHPTSIRELNAFGPYTERFYDIVRARLAIKHGRIDDARKMLDGALAPYLNDPDQMKTLSYALKIAVNIVYGLTSARFPNPFKDPKNKDNIVAKRGALFMIDLKHAVQEQGFIVAHIKTDSIKIPDATPEIIAFVTEFGRKYGYDFEHEATYEKFCLVNKAVYIAKDAKNGEWSATGAQFAEPYVFKTLFSNEKVEFKDLKQTKQVKTALYLDFSSEEAAMALDDQDDLEFIGKVGSFVPIMEDRGGARLLRKAVDKYDSASGAKGYYWLESTMVEENNKQQDVDMSYYTKMVDAAIDNLKQYGDVDWLLAA